MATRKRDIKQAQLFCLMDQAEGINYFAQDANDNQGGPWKIMENQWATQRDAGVSVEVNIKPQFSGNSKRPKEFHITYWYGGSTTPASIQPNGDTFKTVENP